MAFQAPRIIGGGQIIQPQAQGNQFKGIEDAVIRARDRKQKQELIDLERQSQWLQEWDPEAYSRKEWMQMGNEEKQPSFLSLTDKFGYGEGQWAPGKLIGQGLGKGYRSVADYFANKKDDSLKRSVDWSKDKFHTDMKDKLGQDYYNWDDEDSIKDFQSTHMGMVEGDEGFGTYGPRTRAMKAKLWGKQQGGYSYGDEPSGYSLEGGGDVPGNRTGDKNPAMLEDGEYVLNRNAVKSIGKGYLDYINNQKYPRFQSGGFKEPDIAGGTAQVIQPPVMDNSEAFSFGGGGGGGEGGGGEGGGGEDKMAMAQMAMKLFGMNQGGYIPGYQFGGGFSAPSSGASAQIIRPNVMDNSGAFDFGGDSNLGGAPQGGNDPVVTHKTIPGGGHTIGDFSNVDMEWQSGGHVPKYQQGGTVRRPTGYQSGGWSAKDERIPAMAHQYQSAQSRIEDEDRLRRRQEIMGKISGEGIQSAADVDAYNKEIEERVTEEENSPMGYLDWALDKITPEFIEKPLMWLDRGAQQLFNVADDPGESHWLFGQHIPEGNLPSSYYDARRVGGERQMDDYEKEQNEAFQKSALQRASQDPGVLNPEDYAYIQGITSTPSPNPYAGMSNRAMKRLYKEAIQESENNPMDLMKQLYGEEWWKSQQ